MDVSEIVSIIMCVCTMISIFVSVWTVTQSRKEKLTATYYESTAKAYSEYLNSIAAFTYHPSAENRTALSCALYTVLLYGSETVVGPAQEAYQMAIDFSRSRMDDALAVDEIVNRLGDLMRKDLVSFDRQ